MAEDIIARLHDGTELHFPAGTSNDVVDKVVRSHLSETINSSDVPKAFEDKPLTPIAPPNKLIELISGGKAKDLQQFLYGGEQPAESTLGRAGQLIEQSGLEGLTGIGPIAETSAVVPSLLSKSPTIQKAVTELSQVPSEFVGKIGEKIAPIVSKTGEKIKDISASVLGSISNVHPEAYKTVYELYKAGNKELLDKLKNGTKLEKELLSDMIYNYARKLGLPHELAKKPIDYTRGHPKGLGAWDIWDKYAEQFPDIDPALLRIKQGYKPFSELSDVEKAKQAAQAGIDTSRWNIIPPKTGKETIGDYLKLGAKVVTPTVLHSPLATALESPRIARALFSTAGRGARYAKDVPPILRGTRNLSKSQILGGLSQAVPNEED